MPANESCMVSVIISPTGSSHKWKECLDSLAAQTYDMSYAEVIRISWTGEAGKDASLKELQSRVRRLTCLECEAGDLSEARNKAIKAAEGRYILHLDDSAVLSADTLRNVLAFFDANQKDTELVTYRYNWILPDGTKSKHHFRDGILTESGIYDLADPANMYIDQTGMNICVRNSESPILFRKGSKRHADLMYIMAHLQKNSRLGFCAEAEWTCASDPDLSYDPLDWGFYAFEGETAYWEEAFSGKESPLTPYLKAQFISWLERKTRNDALLPYQQGEEQLKASRTRIVQLLNQVNNGIILAHPALQANRRNHYYISQKTNTGISVLRKPDRVEVYDRGNLIASETEIHLQIFRMRSTEGQLEIRGMIDSPLSFYTEDLSLLVRKNGDSFSKAELYPSSFGGDDQLGKPVIVRDFVFRTEEKNLLEVRLFAETGGFRYRTVCEFRGFCQPFSDRLNRYVYCDRDRLYTYQDGLLKFTRVRGLQARKWKRKQWAGRPEGGWTKLTRALATARTGYFDRIWLYYDARDVFRDNGWLQFSHDVRKRDGVRRYYVLNASEPNGALERIPADFRRHVVLFGSHFHKFLLLRAEKILTSFADEGMILPFPPGVYEEYLAFATQPEVIYLQHGVLHAHLPGIYSLDRMWTDREVISTGFEYDNLTRHYGFSEKQLIRSGMPRYDGMDTAREPGRRILLAPSWRRYLVHMEGTRVFPVMNRFRESAFFQETQKLLNSRELADLLEEYGYELDFRLHRLFSIYQGEFQTSSPRIHLRPEGRSEADYRIFMTDFSSYEFDFVYLRRAILHFCPDEELFRAGLNHYRKTDLPEDKSFGETAHTVKQAVECLRKIMENGGRPPEPFRTRMESFFDYRDDKHRERLYRAITGADAEPVQADQ